MLPANRRPSEPTHRQHSARLTPYDRAAERRQSAIDFDLAMGQATIAAASASLANFMYSNNPDEARDYNEPAENPANQS